MRAPWPTQGRRTGPEAPDAATSDSRGLTGGDVVEAALELDYFDGLEGFVFSLLFMIALFILAPVILVIVGVLVFSLELPIVIGIALLILLARFCGLIPWTVLTVDTVSGEETRARYRNLLNAVAAVRETNQDRRVRVRWAWV